MTPAHAAVVFLSSLTADVVWAHWSMATAAKQAFRSALWAVAILLIGVVSIDAYIDSRWYVIPAAAGGGLGTYLAVRRSR